MTDKMHTTNYYNTFIEIAEDCPVFSGLTPPLKGDLPTIAGMQYEIIAQNPYKFTSDEVIFQIFADRKDLIETEREPAREVFFSKGQPCLRSSPLGKKYGWGIHFDEHGKMAIYARESEAYQQFLDNTQIVKTKAMRSKKAS